MADLLFCAHYPFSNEAREYVRTMGISLSPEAVERGLARIESVMRTSSILLAGSGMQNELEGEIVAYAASRVILSCAKNRLLSSRMAVAEAKRARHYIGSSDDQSSEYDGILAEGMGLHFTQNEGGYSLPVWEYLLYTPRSSDYKLTNRELAGGMVMVSAHQRLRIIEEAVKKRIEGAPLPQMKEYPQEVKAAATRAVSMLPREELEPISIANEDFPPCIMKLIDDLRLSINVPHNGRYALCTYLVKAGLTDEQIVKLFRNAPDYNEETTTYQVKYIRTKAYSVPSCATMDTWGICIAECRCGSPVNFRKRMHGENARRSMEMTRHDSVEGEGSAGGKMTRHDSVESKEEEKMRNETHEGTAGKR